jgi:hypothetical protein
LRYVGGFHLDFDIGKARMLLWYSKTRNIVKLT